MQVCPTKSTRRSPIAPNGLLRLLKADNACTDRSWQTALDGVLLLRLIVIHEVQVADVVRRAAEAERQFMVKLEVADQLQRDGIDA